MVRNGTFPIAIPVNGLDVFSGPGTILNGTIPADLEAERAKSFAIKVDNNFVKIGLDVLIP
ncbi:hypothetical protein [Pseudohalioglobus lutimaris]|uniref:Uncharacterized protein n=1 Tax=Pseudohalioglobus lutimaris TaxID=1737061 RepID=A0A2N5X2Y5_9GAMM|nr:hypothetical protein [Pseudohalioglobus lutimaris]PLW68854.1 hypothetical protein C0039_09510 [Pseudohalioglobus lutimaris]